MAGSRCRAARPTIRTRLGSRTWISVAMSNAQRAPYRLTRTPLRGPPRETLGYLRLKTDGLSGAYDRGELALISLVGQHGHEGEPGSISLSNSRRLPSSSYVRFAIPVMLPSGRARLLTKPNASGSAVVAMTMGIVVVACMAARIATGPRATITAASSSLRHSGIRAAR